MNPASNPVTTAATSSATTISSSTSTSSVLSTTSSNRSVSSVPNDDALSRANWRPNRIHGGDSLITCMLKSNCPDDFKKKFTQSIGDLNLRIAQNIV